MLAVTSAPTPALIPSRTSSSTRGLAGQRHDHVGQQVLDAQHVLVARGRRGYSAASAAAKPVSCAARLARAAARTAARPSAQFGIADPGGRVVDRRVRPRVLVGVPAQQRRQPRADRGRVREPASEPDGGVERVRPAVVPREMMGGDAGPMPARRGRARPA